MYDNHAFGDGRLTWNDPLVEGDDALTTIEAATEWLRAGHVRLRQSLAGLDDAQLLQSRMTNWGKLRETRWIIATMIQHDLYHAGEINHIRCLRQQNDE